MSCKIRIIMKKLSTLLFVLFAIAIAVSAQIRTEKDIKKMIKKGVPNKISVILELDKSDIERGALIEEVSLKNPIKGYELNNIEKVLLENYDNVLISGYYPNVYFVIKDNLIGIYNLQGECVIPPIEGRPRHITGTKRIFVGDKMPESRYGTYIMGARGKARRAYAGDFVAVLDYKTLTPIIPLGKYDGIHWTMKGMSSYYYVNKYDEDGIKWGVCDKHGNEIVPCEYKYVGLQSGQFVGDNSKNMEDEMAALNVILKRRQYNSTHKWERIRDAITNVASSLGDAIVSLDNSLSKSGTYDALNSLNAYYGNGGSNLSTQNYNTYDNNAESISKTNGNTSNTTNLTMSDQVNYNSMRNTYNKWADDLQQMKNANGKYQNGYTANQKKHAQSEMERIRKQAKEKWGKEIPYNSIENW